MRRYELTDEQYALLEPYLPRMKRTGGHPMERSPAGAEWAVLEAAGGGAMARHPCALWAVEQHRRPLPPLVPRGTVCGDAGCAAHRA